MASLFDYQRNPRPDYASLGNYAMSQPLGEIPGVTVPLLPNLKPMAAGRFIGMAGTTGDAAGDYAGQTAATAGLVNPGWAGAPSLDAGVGGPGSWFNDYVTSPLKGANTWMQDVGILGGKDDKGNSWNGWGGLALGGLQSAFSAYNGMKMYGLMKDQLAFQKEAFSKNFSTQRALVNDQLESRDRARMAANPGAYQGMPKTRV